MIERACLWRKRSKTFSLSCFVRYPCTWRRASPRRRVCDIVQRKKVFSRRRALMFISQLQVVNGQVATSLSKFAMHRWHRRLCQCQRPQSLSSAFLVCFAAQEVPTVEVCLQGVNVCANRKSRWECSCKVNRGLLCCDWVAPNLSGRRAIPLATDCCSGENRSFKWPRSSLLFWFLLLFFLFIFFFVLFVVSSLCLKSMICQKLTVWQTQLTESHTRLWLMQTVELGAELLLLNHQTTRTTVRNSCWKRGGNHHLISLDSGVLIRNTNSCTFWETSVGLALTPCRSLVLCQLVDSSSPI